jgi:hypothetical protein
LPALNVARLESIDFDVKLYISMPLVPTYLLQAFFEVKIKVTRWVSRGHMPRPATGRPNPTGNPNFNTQKEVLVIRVVLTVGDERTELLPLVRLG